MEKWENINSLGKEIFDLELRLKSIHFIGSLVYSRTKVSIHQNFLNVVVHVIIIDQWIQVTVINCRAILFTVTSECWVKRVICKTWTCLSAITLANSVDLDQTPQNAASDQSLHCLIKLQEVKGWIISSCSGPFPSLHSATIDPAVLSALLYTYVNVKIVSYQGLRLGAFNLKRASIDQTLLIRRLSWAISIRI